MIKIFDFKGLLSVLGSELINSSELDFQFELDLYAVGEYLTDLGGFSYASYECEGDSVVLFAYEGDLLSGYTFYARGVETVEIIARNLLFDKCL